MLCDEVDYFDPVVADWTPECQARELAEREHWCTHRVYVLTPKMTGVYAVAEVVDDSNKRPDTTIFCFLCTDGDDKFTPGQIKSMRAVQALVARNGAVVCQSLVGVSNMLNMLAMMPEEGKRRNDQTHANVRHHRFD